MNNNFSKEKQKFLEDLLDLRKENIKGIRAHLYQMLLLSGAIAAFLMPVYSSKGLSEIQELLIPMSIATFLLAIIFGTVHLSRNLRDENRWLADMHLAVESRDHDAYQRALERSNLSEPRKATGGFYSILVDILFGLGCAIIVIALVLKQYGM